MPTQTTQPQHTKISINLNCYTIRFRKKGDTETYFSYKDVFGNAAYTTIIQKFIDSIEKTSYRNDASDRVLSLQELITVNSRLFSGIIKKGHSSHETYIEEFKDKKSVQIGTLRADQFNSSPFYFLICLPKPDSDFFVFMAQSYKQFGFKEVFEEAFKKFLFIQCEDEYMCEFGTLSAANLFQKYINEGSIRKLRLRKYGLTPELESIVKDDNYKPTDYQIEMSVIAKNRKKHFLHHFREINLKNTSFVETFKVEGFDYSEALVDVTSGGRKRVLNFSDPESFAASYDVTNKSSINANTKHPDFKLLNSEAMSILNDEIIPNIK